MIYSLRTFNFLMSNKFHSKYLKSRDEFEFVIVDDPNKD